MTNEHDVTIARIGAALQILSAKAVVLSDTDVEFSTVKELELHALNFLKQQFAPPEPIVEQPHGNLYVADKSGSAVLRCSRVVPGRSLKREDAIRCSKGAGHKGECDFKGGLSQEQ